MEEKNIPTQIMGDVNASNDVRSTKRAKLYLCLGKGVVWRINLNYVHTSRSAPLRFSLYTLWLYALTYSCRDAVWISRRHTPLEIVIVDQYLPVTRSSHTAGRRAGSLSSFVLAAGVILPVCTTIDDLVCPCSYASACLNNSLRK